MKPLVLVLACLASLVLVACSEMKEEAVGAAIEIRQLCKEKKNDEANTKGVEMYEKNAVFKVAVDDSAAVWKTKDIANYNYCGPAFVDGHRKITEAKDPEGCGCRVVGARNERRRALWLSLGALALVVARRRRRAA